VIEKTVHSPLTMPRFGTHFLLPLRDCTPPPTTQSTPPYLTSLTLSHRAHCWSYYSAAPSSAVISSTKPTAHLNQHTPIACVRSEHRRQDWCRLKTRSGHENRAPSPCFCCTQAHGRWSTVLIAGGRTLHKPSPCCSCTEELDPVCSAHLLPDNATYAYGP